MIHSRTSQGSLPENDTQGETPRSHRAGIANVEVLLSDVRRAKNAADESLRRAQDAPEPHGTINTIFVALWEEHLRDREALFAAMRELDEAREALRATAVKTKTDQPAPARWPAD